MAKIAFSKLNAKVNTDVKTVLFNNNTIEVKQYIPFEQKIEIIQDIVNQAVNSSENYYNPMQVEYLEILAIVENYTNITFTEKQRENSYKLYDSIVSSGLAKLIIEEISDEELNTFNELLTSTLKNIYGYHGSLLGILEIISRNYDNFNLDVTNLKEELSDHAEELKILRDLFKND